MLEGISKPPSKSFSLSLSLLEDDEEEEDFDGGLDMPSNMAAVLFLTVEVLTFFGLESSVPSIEAKLSFFDSWSFLAAAAAAASGSTGFLGTFGILPKLPVETRVFFCCSSRILRAISL